MTEGSDGIGERKVRDDPEVVKLRVECPECGYETLMWSDPDGTRCPECPAEPSATKLACVSGVTAQKAEYLRDAGIYSITDLREATQQELETVDGVSAALAARIKADVHTDHDLTEPVDTQELLDELGYEKTRPTLEVTEVFLSSGRSYHPKSTVEKYRIE